MKHITPISLSSEVLSAYNVDAGRVQIAKGSLPSDPEERKRWMRENGLTPAIEGASYSLFEMAQPFQAVDGTTLTAAAEAALTNDALFTLPANFAWYAGRKLWIRVMGKMSNAVTTPGTWTFRLRYGGLAGTVLVASGAITPQAVAATDNLFFVDLYITCISYTPSSTGLTLLAYGYAELANASGAAADIRAQALPTSGTAVANVASLDPTTAKALTVTVQPSLATGSITCRDAFLVAMN